MITLQFDNAVDDKGVKPIDYMEGHYLYLCCPAVETSTWNQFQEFHPFTISSAPDEPVLEVNIRVMPSPYAWTNKVTRYPDPDPNPDPNPTPNPNPNPGPNLTLRRLDPGF